MDIVIVCDISGYTLINHTEFNILDIINSKTLDISRIESYLKQHDYDCVYINKEFYTSFRKYYPRVKSRSIPEFDYPTEISNFFFKLNFKEITFSKKFDISFDYKEESCLSMALASLSRLSSKVYWYKNA
jgi:hypothetical protein